MQYFTEPQKDSTEVGNNIESDWALISVFTGEWQYVIRKFLSISKILHSRRVVNGSNNQLTEVCCKALLKTKNIRPDILIIPILQEPCRYKWSLEMTAILSFLAKTFINVFFVKLGHRTEKEAKMKRKLSSTKIKVNTESSQRILC